jgi:hypothetical protein
MRSRLTSPAVAVLLAIAAPGPARADELPAGVDRQLWCSSAFYWLAGNAFDSGANAEGRQYEAWSGALMDQGIAALRAAGKDDAEIKTLVEGYDTRVLDQLGTPGAPYDVAACPELVKQGAPIGK